MTTRTRATLLERAAKLAKRLRRVKGLSEVERTFFALGFAATPDERWEINRFWVSRLPPAARKAMEMDMLQSADLNLKL
jgi:hypothetical protein